MTLRVRAAMVLAGALVGLAFAGSALAAYTPRFAVAQSGTATTLHITIPRESDPTAVTNLYVPAGYTATLTQAAGTNIGQAEATVFARDTGLTLPLSGPVTVDDPAKHTADVCSPGTHAAVWILAVEVAGQQAFIPLYIDQTSGAETALGSYRIRTCLPPPDVPAGTPGRAALGAQLLDTKFTVNNIFTAPTTPAVYRWEGLFVPYRPGVGVPNLAGTTEARAMVGVPPRITLRVVYLKKTNTFQLRGRITEGGQGVATTLQIFSGRRPSALKRTSSTKSNAAGNFRTAGHLRPRRTTYFQIRASVAEREVSCASPLPATVAPGGCSTATMAAFTARSATVGIRIR